jgi:hypothetical protein
MIPSTRSAALAHRQASRSSRSSWGRSIPPSCERDRTSGTRTSGIRRRAVPPQASPAACGSGCTWDSAAARSRKWPPKIPADIRACRILLWVESVAERAETETAVSTQGCALRMDSPASHAVFKIAHFEKLRSARGEQAERQFRPLPFKCGLYRLRRPDRYRGRCTRQRERNFAFAVPPWIRMSTIGSCFS